MTSSRFDQMREFTRQFQDDVCRGLEEADGVAKFVEDPWVKEDNRGGGRTRVIRDGGIFEQGGVNWSEVHGTTLPPSILAKYPNLEGKGFRATGTSMVLHPQNPHIPTVHLNYRYFEAGEEGTDNFVWWVGGGMDLTPYYLYEEDCKLFHETIKTACDGCGSESYYKVFKLWADKYFYSKHRKEHRGIGGLFFDYFNEDSTTSLYRAEPASFEYSKDLLEFAEKQSQPARTFADVITFVKACAGTFLPAYTEIIRRRRDTAVTEAQRDWQLYRRGRYVEFNLVYDRGTVFGLQTGGRTESILMSLPPLVRFEYNYTPKEGSPEYNMWQVNLAAREWC